MSGVICAPKPSPRCCEPEPRPAHAAKPAPRTPEPQSRSACEHMQAPRFPDPEPEPRPHLLEPESLSRHIDKLFRAAWALCGSRDDAEDLVQETFVNVLKRPRWLRNPDEIGYLLRALRNTYNSRYRTAAQRPREHQLLETDLLEPTATEPEINAREIMEAIASVPPHYRDAVIAIDLVGLSYREAARLLRTREATITTRLHRGRQYVARALLRGSAVGA
jgi:RNA polymerase sigma-70 factor, ECF subfamily